MSRLLLGSMLAAGCSSEPSQLRVMTFNVLCSFCDPDYDPWEERLAYFDDLLGRHAPDLVGLQEIAFAAEVDQILGRSPRYRATYFDEILPEDGLPHPYPDATIFYDSMRFDVLDSGSFWLSPSPDEPFSTGFAEGRQLPRLVTWARLQDRLDESDLVFASTHFDNNSPSQDKSAPLVLERLPAIAGAAPLIFVGDFNSQPPDPAYQSLDGPLTNTFDLASWRIDTNQDPVPAYDPSARIDHIFLDEKAAFSVDDWVVDLHVYGDRERYPSDHRAMAATLSR